MMNKISFAAVLLILFASLTGCSKADNTETKGEVVPGLPVKNTVTLVELGADTCVPCRLMAPIIEELTKEYKGRAEITFIDVGNEDNIEKARAFKVLVIPTQIIYDKSGKEVFRHSGFLEKKTIVAKLEELLARK